MSLSMPGTSRTVGFILLLAVLAWLGYGLFGHRAIEAIYQNESIDLVNKLMAGRKTTPLHDYFAGADRIFIRASTGLLLLLPVLVLLMAFLKKPREMLLACASFLVFSLFLFSVLELFPSLIAPLQLDRLPYYRMKVSRVPDDTLGYRHAPGMNTVIAGYRSGLYSPVYGVDIPPRSVEWVTNDHGFRAESTVDTADVVVIGDSFIEFGDREAETFGKILERRLGGPTVANFGISGYGPFQYLEVLKRYGIKKKPQAVLFCFYEGNDIKNIDEYLSWQEHETGLAAYELTSKTFLQRYWILATGIVERIQSALGIGLELLLKRLTGDPYIHPDLVVLNLGDGGVQKALLHDKHAALPPEAMLKSDDWQHLREILHEFRRVSEQGEVAPIIVHIPMTASIYAEYSTEESGRNWRRVREAQVARSRNMEVAMERLSREVGVEFVNLGPVFRSEAKRGRLLYEPIDTHWNLEGREVAARYVAEKLRALGL